MECICSSHLSSFPWGPLLCSFFRCSWLWGLGRSPSIALEARGAFVGITQPLLGAPHASVCSRCHRLSIFRPAQKQSQAVAWHALRGR